MPRIEQGKKQQLQTCKNHVFTAAICTSTHTCHTSSSMDGWLGQLAHDFMCGGNFDHEFTTRTKKTRFRPMLNRNCLDVIAMDLESVFGILIKVFAKLYFHRLWTVTNKACRIPTIGTSDEDGHTPNKTHHVLLLALLLYSSSATV